MKRITCVSIILVLLLALSFTSLAINLNSDIVESNERYTIEKAQELALKNSRQVAIDDLEIIAKETALKQAHEDAGSVAGGITPAAALRDRITVQVKVAEAEAALGMMKMVKKDNYEQLKLDVKNTFYNILLAQKELEKESKKLEFIRERLEMAKSKYEANNITKDALDTAEYDLYSKTIEVESVKERIKTLDMMLKDKMNMPLGGDLLMLDGTIEQEEFVTIDIDKTLESSIESDTAVYSAAEKYKAAEKTMELTKELFKEGSETYDNNMVSLETALRDYEASLRNKEVDIRNTYNEVLNLSDNVDLAERYEELQKKKLDNMKIKYDKGQISKELYMSAEETYLDAAYNKYRAICEFNIKMWNFYSKIEAS